MQNNPEKYALYVKLYKSYGLGNKPIHRFVFETGFLR